MSPSESLLLIPPQQPSLIARHSGLSQGARTRTHPLMPGQQVFIPTRPSLQSANWNICHSLCRLISLERVGLHKPWVGYAWWLVSNGEIILKKDWRRKFTAKASKNMASSKWSNWMSPMISCDDSTQVYQYVKKLEFHLHWLPPHHCWSCLTMVGVVNKRPGKYKLRASHKIS